MNVPQKRGRVTFLTKQLLLRSLFAVESRRNPAALAGQTAIALLLLVPLLLLLSSSLLIAVAAPPATRALLLSPLLYISSTPATSTDGSALGNTRFQTRPLNILTYFDKSISYIIYFVFLIISVIAPFRNYKYDVIQKI